MSLLYWKPEYSVGVAAVDFEHEELIELINELHAGLERDESPEAVPDFLGEVYTKIAAHFALEERIMRERGYDEFQDHKADHTRLLDEIRDMMDDYEVKGVLDEEELSRRLQGWFGEHFRTKDARLHKFLD